jgi:hypothetical protein
MTDVDLRPPQPATAKQLWMATAAAAAVAALLLGTIVLPAEYGVDPLGTGAALGLVRPDEPPPLTFEHALVPVQTGPLAQFAAPYKIDVVSFDLDPYQFLEYKYHLAQGAGLVFSWGSSAPVMYDFHGAPDGGSSASEVSVDRRTGDGASGGLAAPFAGMHGWYWENPGGTPIAIRLSSAGFYDVAVEYRSDGRRITREPSPATSLFTAPER